MSNAQEHEPLYLDGDDVPVGVTLDRICAGCGADYQWTSREGYEGPTKYCTRSCGRRAQRRRQPDQRMKLDESLDVEGAQADGMVLLICGRCWVPFGWIPPADKVLAARAIPPTYHSLSCQGKAKKKRAQERIRQQKEDRTERKAISARTAAEEELRRVEEEHAARVAAESAAARELLLPASYCRVCGKVASPTERAAKETKRAIEARAGRTNAVRYYQCPDGWWHWTRMGADLDGWRAEHLMTESPASLRHQGRGAWRVLGDVR